MAKKKVRRYKALKPLTLNLDPENPTALTQIKYNEIFDVVDDMHDETRLVGLAVPADEDPNPDLAAATAKVYEEPVDYANTHSLADHIKDEEDRREKELEISALDTKQLVLNTEAHQSANDAAIAKSTAVSLEMETDAAKRKGDDISDLKDAKTEAKDEADQAQTDADTAEVKAQKFQKSSAKKAADFVEEGTV